jgi:hypothetical protein
MRWVGHVARTGERRGVHRILVRKPEGKRQLGRPGRRWENNIEIHSKEVGWRDMDWIDLAWDRDIWRVLVIAEMKLKVT